MDIKRLIEVLSANASPRPSKKNKFDMMMRCNDGVDRINQLPDEVIEHMLSFLPLKSAAATSLLSRRWIHLWKRMPNLVFEDFLLQHKLYHIFKPRDSRSRDEYERGELRMRKYIHWVNSVLGSYKSSSLQEFSIAVLVDKSTQHEFTKWLEFTFSRRVQTLKLISNEAWANAGVLADMLKDTSIPSSDFKSLKVLWLKEFKTISSDAIEFFLRNCPSLERLVLETLTMTSDLEVVGGLQLKHLDMRTRMSENSVKVCAPNLTCLTIDHSTRNVSLENVPKLVNLAFYCRPRYGDTMHHFAKVAAQFETLIISLLHPKSSFSVPDMPKLKKLVVYYTFMDVALLPVTCFLRASPALEEFKIDISSLPAHEELFRIPKDCPAPVQHRHLRRFVLSGFCGRARDRIELVRYVVNNCAALEEIVVGPCDREGLARDFVDHCVPLHHMFWRPPPISFCHMNYVTTPQEWRDIIEEDVRLFTPARIKLRVI